jgi:type I restriction enzyme S subunit
MAKAKKKENLTPEERLQAALVPDWEQPYKVPENWCWTRLGVLLQNSKEKTSDFTNANLKYVGLEHMQKDYGIVAYDSAIGLKSLKNVFHPNQILYGKLRPYLNKHDVATFEGICSTDILVFNVTSLSMPKFVNFFLNQNTFIEYAVSNSKGINLPRISENVILDAKCPLPPLPEQQRIVDRIESLFDKLDEAKQKAQDALDSFETRKAAILHKAFTGELTVRWRNEHGVGMESWEKANLGKYVDSQYGYTESASQEQIGPKFLRITDIQNGIVNWDDVPFCKISDSDFDRYAVSKNDIVIARTGATTGKSYLIVDDVEAVFASYLIRIKIKSAKLSPQYLYCFLQSQMYWNQITEFSAGIAQPGVNAKKLKEIILPIPAISEQAEIVRILDDLLAKEQQNKEATEAVLEQIDLIKKSILARAFRGELGTNDPAEESAVELVKKII